MKTFTIAALVLLASAVTAAAAPTVPEHHTADARGQVSFRVERGDTFQNLFGRDWYEAWRQNPTVVVRGGRVVSSPDILLEGTYVTVAGAVQLTDRARARVAALGNERERLARRLAAIDAQLGTTGRGRDLLAAAHAGLTDLQVHPQRAVAVGWQIVELEALAHATPPIAPRVERVPVPAWLPLVALAGIAAFGTGLRMMRRAARRHDAEATVRYGRALERFRSLVDTGAR